MCAIKGSAFVSEGKFSTVLVNIYWVKSKDKNVVIIAGIDGKEKNCAEVVLNRWICETLSGVGAIGPLDRSRLRVIEASNFQLQIIWAN